MTDNYDDFFAGSVRSGAPSAKLSNINDGVVGEVVDQFKVDKKKYKSDEVEKDKYTGEPIQQLVLVLQTDQRNWAGVSRIPVLDPEDKNSPQKPPGDDDGRRSIYVPPFTNLHSAVGRATAATNGGKPIAPRIGAKLGVKVVNLEDTGRGEPKRVFEAMYQPASPTDGFFAGAGAPAQAPAQQAAPQQQDPWAGQQAAPAQQAVPQQQDPWAGQQAAPAQQAAPQRQDPWAGQQAAPAQGGPPF